MRAAKMLYMLQCECVITITARGERRAGVRAEYIEHDLHVTPVRCLVAVDAVMRVAAYCRACCYYATRYAMTTGNGVRGAVANSTYFF